MDDELIDELIVEWFSYYSLITGNQYMTMIVGVSEKDAIDYWYETYAPQDYEIADCGVNSRLTEADLVGLDEEELQSIEWSKEAWQRHKLEKIG